MIKDWMRTAADEIGDEVDETSFFSTDEMITIIARHCPFKQDVAYMPVPRCDGCEHWDQEGRTIEDTAECLLPIMRAIIDSTTITGEEIHVDFQMRTKKDFGCVQWEAK